MGSFCPLSRPPPTQWLDVFWTHISLVARFTYVHHKAFFFMAKYLGQIYRRNFYTKFDQNSVYISRSSNKFLILFNILFRWLFFAIEPFLIWFEGSWKVRFVCSSVFWCSGSEIRLGWAAKRASQREGLIRLKPARNYKLKISLIARFDSTFRFPWNISFV